MAKYAPFSERHKIFEIIEKDLESLIEVTRCLHDYLHYLSTARTFTISDLYIIKEKRTSINTRFRKIRKSLEGNGNE